MGKTAIGLVIVAVLVLGGGTIWLVTKNNNTKVDTMSNMDMHEGATTSGSSKPTATNSVTIENFAFSPANITVKKGTTVTWTNKDSTAHTVTENDGKNGPDSSSLDQGKSYSFTYDTVGTFKYHCSFHPNMVGTVTVTE